MSEFSPIEWTDATWNPLLGCDKCSAGCKFCYAIRTAWRLMHNPNPTIAAAYAGLVEKRPDGSLNWTGKINLLPERLNEPRRWRLPRRIFVNSQSDLFHDAVPDEFIDQVFAAMISCPQHTFQVLTKRAARMRDYMTAAEERVARAGMDLADSMGWCHAYEDTPWPPPHVWLGVSVEDQRAADERCEAFRNTPAAVHFVSYEPAIGPVDWTGWEFIGWLISGGESGANARPSHPDWHRAARDFCQGHGKAYLFKQWGEWVGADQGAAKALPTPHDVMTRRGNVHVWPTAKPPGPPHFGMNFNYRVGKKAAGRLLDGRTHNEFPQPATVANA